MRTHLDNLLLCLQYKVDKFVLSLNSVNEQGALDEGCRLLCSWAPLSATKLVPSRESESLLLQDRPDWDQRSTADSAMHQNCRSMRDFDLTKVQSCETFKPLTTLRLWKREPDDPTLGSANSECEHPFKQHRRH